MAVSQYNYNEATWKSSYERVMLHVSGQSQSLAAVQSKRHRFFDTVVCDMALCHYITQYTYAANVIILGSPCGSIE